MVTNNHYRWDFIGLSTDVKPTPATSEKVVDGSTFYCSDTSKLYVYCKDNWYERKPLGGGGGGSYTAGTGIDITDSTISVDTTAIQEKLTAGTNITIEDNVISASGGGVNVVQATGTSTTNVMSQNAVSSMIFADAGIDTQIKIGDRATCAGINGVAIGTYASATTDNSVVIGPSATAQTQNVVAIGNSAYGKGWGAVAIGDSSSTVNYTGAVALGSNARCSRAGEVNIGAGNTANGYNSTSYRVIGGVYDGQLAQDAVTVAQVNATIDAINTALSTNIPHIGA